MQGSHRSLFYKTAPYKYAKHFNLTSVLDGLQGYKIVSGEADAIDDHNSGVFGELKAREKPQPSENKFYTRQIVKKPPKYNPYSRTTSQPQHKYTTEYDAPLPSGEQEEESSDDFFGLNDAQQSVAHTNSAFPGYQPYDSSTETTTQFDAVDDDDIPPPTMLVAASQPHYSESDDTSLNDFYSNLEMLAGRNTATYGEPKKTDAGKSLTSQIQLPETAREQWNYGSHKYQTRQSSLCTFKCWKCKRVGHLPEDCTASIGVAAPTAADPHRTHSQPALEGGAIYTPQQRKMYAKCQKISQNGKSDKCGECGARANLAQCLDCGVVVCDNKGHLQRHLLNNPSHNMLYSYKLRRQIKCCKSTCRVSNAYKLYACAECVDRCFERHYNMMNATWSGVGLKYIANAICCDDHFEWHRINCANSRTGFSSKVVERDQLGTASQLSEHFF